MPENVLPPAKKARVIRATIKRPLKLELGKKTPAVTVDGVLWILSKKGHYIIDRADFRDKDVIIPVEALKYIAAVFKTPEVEFIVSHTPHVTFSSKQNRAQAGRVAYSVGKATTREWYYMTPQGFKQLVQHFALNAPRAYKTLKKLVPATDFPKVEKENHEE